MLIPTTLKAQIKVADPLNKDFTKISIIFSDQMAYTAKELEK
jgi:hypothetical protein